VNFDAPEVYHFYYGDETGRPGTLLTFFPLQDRMYFRSIYFHEPGGVSFEIATDGPGMLIDEPVSELGSHLKLPPWFEPKRERIERMLIPVAVPEQKRN